MSDDESRLRDLEAKAEQAYDAMYGATTVQRRSVLATPKNTSETQLVWRTAWAWLEMLTVSRNGSHM